jgi:hypothetical protein
MAPPTPRDPPRTMATFDYRGPIFMEPLCVGIPFNIDRLRAFALASYSIVVRRLEAAEGLSRTKNMQVLYADKP